ncbi:OmpA family protein [Psychroserpens sp.]|uniref:OmpA family protein n=1 Tax=Psychroserpens sp. TaxID=2020870 RepID=UPI002AA90696|nr:OmpA family protein [Psychroserpens sp.]
MSSIFILFFLSTSVAQTKKIKRPKSSVGISSVDTFVRESFDIYDKVYKYDGYAASGTPLEDEDIDVLEEALDELAVLTETLPNILDDIEGQSVFKQGKATLQMNKAKKALKYSTKTAKELLLGQREREGSSEDESEENNESETIEDTTNESNNKDSNESTIESNPNISDNLEILSKFDFVPGDELLFFDDFSQDFVGDFPSKWNTNGSGETVKINNENWLEIRSGYGIFYIPDIEGLPEDYSIEFDVLTKGISNKTSSTARFFICLSDNLKFNKGEQHYTEVSLPFGQFGVFNIRNYNFFNRGSGDINSQIKADIRSAVLNQPHISIAVTKKRFRLWVNEVKYVDIPRFIQELNVLNHIKFNISGFQDGTERVFIKNLKVAKGGVDLRRKLMSEGKISTNGILFDSGSATIQSQSYGIIRQISQVLQQDSSINLLIVGHTDSDGDDQSNLELSKSRANAVKQALINVYKIDGNRLLTDGKGEIEPVQDNNTPNGKAQNRRVEFIKQ